ncbi:uncharacterized protein LOC134684878 [Mytilus trossulus]|uniref:uncharacterized protein LOC134684878 n=1 Tax=Mytilus trossulus TaxID=6551 RepID=UPI0030057B29
MKLCFLRILSLSSDCLHDTLDDREWIKKDCKVYQAIEKIAKERTLMKDIGKLSPAEKTSSLESYHRVVCFFAPKSVHFKHAKIEARIYLAAMHFNENSSRPQAVTSTGTAQLRVSYPKARKGKGVAKEVKVNATYGYVQELFQDLLFRRERLKSYSEAIAERRRDDKVRPLPLSHSKPHPPKADIFDNHK